MIDPPRGSSLASMAAVGTIESRPVNDLPKLLVIVRHAESARNLAKVGRVFFADDEARSDLKNEPDHLIRLTETGWSQARELGTKLRDSFQSFDSVFHSGYRRTQETAEAVLEAWPADERSRMAVRAHLFLRERDVGYAFNFTADEARQTFPWLQPHWDLTGHFFARPPGGESLADVAMRVHLFLESSRHDLAGKSVLIVTHGGPLRMFRYWLEAWTYEDVIDRWDREAVPNCCVVSYRAGERSDRLERVSLPPVVRPLDEPEK